MTAFSAKTFAQGQLGAAEAVIHTVPVMTVDYLKSFNVYNTSAITQTVLVKIGMRAWRRVVLAQNESADLLDSGETLELEAGLTVSASSTNPAAVDFTICGVRES